MPPGNAIVIDLRLTPITGQTLFRLALWNGAAAARIGTGLGTQLPAPCRSHTIEAMRLLWLETGHWLIACASADADAFRQRVESLAGADGSLVEVGAALAGRCITGGGWRELLMIGGVFDAENPGFGPGSVARTTMHHSPLLIDVIATDRVHAYVPASYADEFFGFWGAEIARAKR
jgi:heterotetrameric sarcosine oxidase gamma subunit